MIYYLDYFLKLKCAGDVLNTCYPIGNKPSKEITESMSVIRKLKKIVLKEPMKYTVYDLCAGNALTSVLACYFLPIKGAIAIDKRTRSRRYHLAQRFRYEIRDIYNLSADEFVPHSIIIAIHACGKLSDRIIELYKSSENVEYLIMMPCCVGNIDYVKLPRAIEGLIDKYKAWVWNLAIKCGVNSFSFDRHCISPKNGIIVASKKQGG